MRGPTGDDHRAAGPHSPRAAGGKSRNHRRRGTKPTGGPPGRGHGAPTRPRWDPVTVFLTARRRRPVASHTPRRQTRTAGRRRRAQEASHRIHHVRGAGVQTNRCSALAHPPPQRFPPVSSPLSHRPSPPRSGRFSLTEHPHHGLGRRRSDGEQLRRSAPVSRALFFFFSRVSTHHYTLHSFFLRFEPCAGGRGKKKNRSRRAGSAQLGRNHRLDRDRKASRAAPLPARSALTSQHPSLPPLPTSISTPPQPPPSCLPLPAQREAPREGGRQRLPNFLPLSLPARRPRLTLILFLPFSSLVSLREQLAPDLLVLRGWQRGLDGVH